MLPRSWRLSWRMPAILVIILGCPAIGLAQQSYGTSNSPSSQGPPRPIPKERTGPGGSEKLSAPEPYGGQLFCPVTGVKLGLNQPAVLVQTTIGEQKPSGLAKLFGKKPVPGAVIYVCCPQCAEQVRRDPERYLGEVVADKAYFSSSFTYAKAPARRPARSGDSSTIEPASFQVPAGNPLRR